MILQNTKQKYKTIGIILAVVVVGVVLYIISIPYLKKISPQEEFERMSARFKELTSQPDNQEPFIASFSENRMTQESFEIESARFKELTSQPDQPDNLVFEDVQTSEEMQQEFEEKQERFKSLTSQPDN